jgi:hypothetical protein
MMNSIWTRLTWKQLYELIEHLIVKADDEHGFHLHCLAALHVAQRTLL